MLVNLLSMCYYYESDGKIRQDLPAE